MHNSIAFCFFCTNSIPHTNTGTAGIGQDNAANTLVYILAYPDEAARKAAGKAADKAQEMAPLFCGRRQADSENAGALPGLDEAWRAVTGPLRAAPRPCGPGSRAWTTPACWRIMPMRWP